MSKAGILIGIAGASGSGKTLVARSLIESLESQEVVIIEEDAYYKDLDHLSVEERSRFNFDHPHAFDHDLLLQQLKALQAGQAIEQPVYDYATHTRKKTHRRIAPHQIIIVEGILILAIPEIRQLLDIRLFVDTDPDLCLIRRLKRDLEERGRTVASVLRQYQETVRPMYLQFIEPSKRYADLVIPHGGKNVIAIDIIKSKIEKLLV